MARSRCGGARIAVIVTIVTAMFLAGGCGSPAEDADDVTVRIKLAAKEEVALWIVEGRGDGEDIFANVDMKRVRESTDKILEFFIPSGGLLRVVVRAPDDEGKPLCFPYRHDAADKQPLVFSRSGFRGTVNGKTIHLDLTTSEAIDWLAKQPASTAKAVRSIRLAGDSADNARALSHLADSRPIVVFDFEKGFGFVKKPEVIKALTAARPSGLFAPGGENLGELIAGLPDLEYFGSTGQRIPDLASLRKLKVLSFKFDEDGPGSLAPLDGVTGLQGLCIGGSKTKES